MQATEIIQAVKQGQAKHGWAIFRYSKKNWAIGLIARAFYTLFPLGVFIIFYWELWQTGSFNAVSPDEQIMGGIMLAVALLFLYSFIRKAMAFFHIKTNMVVLTDKALIKSWNTKTQVFPYTEISKLYFQNVPGNNTGGYRLFYKSYLEFIDNQSNRRIAIGRDDYFQDVHDIFTILQSKLN